jgi:hypothetical protein
MTKLDAIREIIIKDASESQVNMFDRYLKILKSRYSQDDETCQILMDEAPFKPQEKLLGELTGERILSMFSVVFGILNAPRATVFDQQSAINGLLNGLHVIE